MRFYSIQPTEMECLDHDFANRLYQCVDILQAREALIGIKIAEYPYLKKEGQSRVFKDLKKRAYPSIIKKEARAITMADLANMLKG